MTTKPTRNDPAVAPEFRKDPLDERFLEHLNDCLAPHERALHVEPGELDERWPTIHVIGPPRSGTTLATQLIAAHLDVGCINNLVAAFWAAPVHGIRLAKRLLPIPAPSTYESRYGRTQTISEPHEFGYFWASLLGYRDMVEPTPEQIADVDWDRVRATLLNMNEAYGRPTLFKSFMAAFYLPGLLRALQRTCLVRMRRAPVDNALSVLGMRREYASDPSVWVSLRPREYAWLKSESLPRQAAGQVVFTHAAIDRGLAQVEHPHMLDVDYEQMCADPAGFLARVQSMLARAGAVVELVRPAPAPFELRRTAPNDDAELAELEAALAEFSAPRF